LAGGGCALGRFGLRRQVVVGIEAVALELHAKRLFGEIVHGDAAGEGAAVELQVQVFQGQAGWRALEAADQFDFAQAALGHRWQWAADAVEELGQVELGDGQGAAELWGLVQVIDLQLAQGAQLVGRQFQVGPFGNVGRLVHQQLTLGGEGHGLALQRLASGFAADTHVFELVALEGALNAQIAVELGLDAHYRLVAAEEGGELHRNAGAFVHGTGAQLDALGAELFAGLLIVVFDAGVVDRQAVDIQADRLGRLLWLGFG